MDSKSPKENRLRNTAKDKKSLVNSRKWAMLIFYLGVAESMKQPAKSIGKSKPISSATQTETWAIFP